MGVSWLQEVSGRGWDGCDDMRRIVGLWEQDGGRMDVTTGSELEYHGDRK